MPNLDEDGMLKEIKETINDLLLATGDSDDIKGWIVEHDVLIVGLTATRCMKAAAALGVDKDTVMKMGDIVLSDLPGYEGMQVSEKIK